MSVTTRPRQGRMPSVAFRLLVALLAVDLVFLILHATHVRFDVPGSGRWLISMDRGFPELYQYLKEVVIVWLLIASFRIWRSPVQLTWAALFCYLLVDDSLEVHETVGEWLGFGDVLGIEGRDVGQIAVSATVGICLLVALVVTTARDHTPARGLSVALAPVVLALGFFGVVADVIDVIDVLGLVEDGGEMAAMSAAVAIVVTHWRAAVLASAAGRSGP